MAFRGPAFIALMALAAIGADPAIADPGDMETITSCLKAEQDAGRDARSCVGVISKPCMEQPGGDSTVGMTMCFDRETKAWDDLLNIEYQKLLGTLDPNAVIKVRTAQRAWIASRDADCAVPYGLFEGGTIAQPMSVECMQDATATRTLQLREWRQLTDN